MVLETGKGMLAGLILVAVLIMGLLVGLRYTGVTVRTTAPITESINVTEITSMHGWWYTNPKTGGRRRIEVYRRDYDSDQEWLAGIRLMEAEYPPDPEDPPE